MKILKYIKTNVLVYFLIGMFLNSGLMLIKPLILERLLNIREEQLTTDTIFSFVLYGFCLHLIFYSTMLLANFVSNNLQRHLQLRLKNKLMKKLFLKESITHDEKVSILTQDMELLYDRFLLPIDIIIGKAFILCTTIAFILWQNFWVGLLFVTFSFLRPLPQVLMNNRLINSGADFSRKQKDFHRSVGDLFRGADTFYFYGASEEKLSSLKKVNANYEDARWKNEWTSNITYFFNGPLVFFSQVLPLALGLFLQKQGVELTTASLIAMYIATMNLSGPLQTMMYSFSDIQRSSDIRNKIFSLLETPGLEYSYITADSVSEMVLEKVSKQTGERVLFQNLSLKLSMPCKVLIKGASGSGKSTLLRIIAGKISPDTGRVFIRNNKGEEFLQFQGNVAYISQHPFFSHGSIRENLTMGQNISDSKLLYYLDQVGLTKEIPAILDYHLENNGENISGGQRLRLELVRCLLRKKDIVLADEITAALDQKNAQVVRQILLNLPIILVEVAHHIDSETNYDQTIDLEEYR
ncbi:ATP-binding cassette domain-containing protein [Facklamia miroungae]|uniref:ABC-type multidrug transport system, ATPase and permease component n=1 Tax=Facklamia miroungae TaxID=120956 RepID=A0A1G7TED7_9LACT|nr:ABC transporter ATP-binding protein [Facklamia miroungae]NKZ29763.1 ABC transporter ATP-binding protein [Facklamia miroungae]SDG32920.1 ABC-type multidrug transport system, ATPase and permease component [Facklamia miroungae]